MSDEIKGYRTLIAGLFGMVLLVVGLWLLKEDQRGAAYVFFSGGIGAIVASLVVKSVGTSAVNGEGLKGGLANLMSDSKPGEPKP